jgi:hypothetical protein
MRGVIDQMKYIQEHHQCHNVTMWFCDTIQKRSVRPSLEQCLSGIEGHDEDTRIYPRTFDQQSGQIVYTSSNTTYEVFAYVAKLRLNFVQSNQDLA